MNDFASEHPGQQGWLGDRDEEKRLYDDLQSVVPERVQRFAAKTVFNNELLEQTKQIQNANGIEDGFCFLYLVEAIFGEQFRWLPQIIGSCVASGDMRTTSYRMLAEVFLLNDPEQLPGIDIEGRDAFAPFAPYSYRAGRKIAGINSGDGSYCAAHIKGKMQYGTLWCNSGVQSDSYPEPQNSRTYRQWGDSNSLLDQWAPEGRKFPLLESEKVTSFDDIKTLLTEHYKPANICSMWGFKPSHDHATWTLASGDPVSIYRKSGQWAHNMSVIGVVKSAGDWFVIIENSWGNAHRNGQWFAIPATLFQTWIRQAECMSVGEIDMTDSPSPWPDER